MPFRCKQAFPREEKCLLDLLRFVLQSFILAKDCPSISPLLHSPLVIGT
jgi:hypothetical protein